MSLPEIRSLAITRNGASVQLTLNAGGVLWLNFKTPRGNFGLNVKGNFDFKQDVMGIAADFFQRAEEGDKLCDGCRFRHAVSKAIKRGKRGMK